MTARVLSAAGPGHLVVAPACIVLASLVFALTAPRFLDGGNLLNLATQMWVLALVATGQMFALVTRGFDISVGAVAALAGVGSALGANAFGWGGLVLGPMVGLACGTFNGWLIGSLRVTPVIATLATLVGVRGLALLVTGDGQAIPLLQGGELARWAFGSSLGLPPVDWVAVASVVAAHLVLTRSIAGRQMVMLGSNPEAVHLVGIDERRVARRAYQLCGLFAGLAGTLITLRAGTGLPVEGSGMELQSIAAAVIGGTSLAGGVASVPGVLAGALFIQVLLTGLNLTGLSPFVAQTAVGLVIIGAGFVAFGLRSLNSPASALRRAPR